MGECLILKAGTGTDTSNATAKSEYILSGYTAYVNDMLITGTMVNHGSISNELSAGDIVKIKKGYYELSTLTVKTLASQTEATAISSDILASKTAWVNGALLTGDMINRGAVTYGLPINGAYTIPSGFHNGAGKVTQSIATQGGTTITPWISNVLACAAGRYTTGAIWVAGDGNLVSGNIRKGVSIFGVGGSFEGPRFWIYNRGHNPYQLKALTKFDNMWYDPQCVSFGSDHIEKIGGSGYKFSIGPSIPIDLTSFKYLTVNMSGYVTFNTGKQVTNLGFRCLTSAGYYSVQMFNRDDIRYDSPVSLTLGLNRTIVGPTTKMMFHEYYERVKLDELCIYEIYAH